MSNRVKSEAARITYEKWLRLDLLKDLRQLAKDNRTFNKWLLLILSFAAIVSISHGDTNIVLLDAVLIVWSIYDIIRYRREIREYDEQIADAKWSLQTDYVHGVVEEE